MPQSPADAFRESLARQQTAQQTAKTVSAQLAERLAAERDPGAAEQAKP